VWHPLRSLNEPTEVVAVAALEEAAVALEEAQVAAVETAVLEEALQAAAAL